LAGILIEMPGDHGADHACTTGNDYHRSVYKLLKTKV
jgi:hypothetical protein